MFYHTQVNSEWCLPAPTTHKPICISDLRTGCVTYVRDQLSISSYIKTELKFTRSDIENSRRESGISSNLDNSHNVILPLSNNLMNDAKRKKIENDSYLLKDFIYMYVSFKRRLVLFRNQFKSHLLYTKWDKDKERQKAVFSVSIKRRPVEAEGWKSGMKIAFDFHYNDTNARMRRQRTTESSSNGGKNSWSHDQP